MAQPYQLIAPPPGLIEEQVVLRVIDQAHIPFDPANADYAEYCAWLAEGNTPDPAPAS